MNRLCNFLTVPFNLFQDIRHTHRCKSVKSVLTVCKRITSIYEYFLASKGMKDKLPLYDEQTVSGLMKIAKASVFPFKTAAYIYIYAAVYIYMRKIYDTFDIISQ